MAHTPIYLNLKRILARTEAVSNTAETLAAADGKARVTVGTSASDESPREDRDIARGTFSPMGTLESTKAVLHTIGGELNTPDTFGLTVQAACTGSLIATALGIMTVNITGNVAAGVAVGDLINVRCPGSTLASGTHIITSVAAGSLTVINRAAPSLNVLATNTTANVLRRTEFGPLMTACGTKARVVYTCTIGAVTSGPFVRNETITQTTSGATGRVVKACANGDATIMFVPINGIVFTTGAVVTGGTSGATATTSAAEAVAGYSILPSTPYFETATVRNETDGKVWQSRGTAGNMTMQMDASKKAMVAFAMSGARSSLADAALTSVTQDTEQPPILQIAALTMTPTGGSAFSPVGKTISFDMGNKVVARENFNSADTTGLEGYIITGRSPKLKISYEHTLSTNFDFVTLRDAGTDIAIKWQVGTATGKTILCFVDSAEILNGTLGENNGAMMMDLELLCKGEGSAEDREFEFVLV